MEGVKNQSQQAGASAPCLPCSEDKLSMLKELYRDRRVIPELFKALEAKDWTTAGTIANMAARNSKQELLALIKSVKEDEGKDEQDSALEKLERKYNGQPEPEEPAMEEGQEETEVSLTEKYASMLYGSDEEVFDISEGTADVIRSIFKLTLVRGIVELMPVDSMDDDVHADGQDASLCALDDEIDKLSKALARSIVENLRSYPANVCECCGKIMV